MIKQNFSISIRLKHFFERRIRNIRDSFRSYEIEELPKEIYDLNALNTYKVSFCTTCMNRAFHLKKTISKNIRNNLKYPNCEFVLINYNSQDGLHEWVLSELSDYIESGVLKYFYTKEPKNFHASIAKNMAHRFSTGDILCNLDADNFTGKDFAFYLNYLLNTYGENCFYQFTKPPYWGTVGRIAMSRSLFLELGGYDETFLPIGHEDLDLIERAEAYGANKKVVKIENFLQYLSNTSIEKSINCYDQEYMNYYDLEDKNRKISKEKIKSKEFIANKSGFKDFKWEFKS